MEIETSGYGVSALAGRNNREVLCAVCFVKRGAMIMHPGSQDCPAKWTKEPVKILQRTFVD